MIYKNIDIIKQKDGSYFLLSKSNLSIINKDSLIIESIFWYPLIEMDYYEFVSVLKNKGYDNFPVILLIKSIILKGTFYWVNKALIWYDKLPIYDPEIQVSLNDTLLNLKDSGFQNFKQKIKIY